MIDERQPENLEIDLKAVLAILQRQRRLLFATLALAASLALAYIMLATPIYTSTVLIQVDGRSSNILDPSSAGQEQSAILNSRVDSEVEILRSEATALAVVRQANLMADPEFGPQLGWLERLSIVTGGRLDIDQLRRVVGLSARDAPSDEALLKNTILQLQNAVDIRRRGLTYLIAISVSSSSPARASEIANVYASVYIDRQVATKTEATLAARDVLSKQIANAQEELAASEAAMNSFIEQNLERLENETSNPEIAALRTQLDATKMSQAVTSARAASARSALQARDWQSVAQNLEDQAVSELERQRQALVTRLGAAPADSTEAVDLQGEIASLEQRLAQQTENTLADLSGQISEFRTQESETRDALRNALMQSDLSPEMLSELFSLQQNATVARDQYQTLVSREQDLGTLANLQIADARVVSEALPPNNPSAPNARLILALALVGGVGLGVLLAFLKEYYVGGISSANQLANVLQAPVPVTFSVLDQLKSGDDPADIVVSSPMTLYCESFRKLRASIDVGLAARNQPEGNQGKGRVILVCSALQAEGKSTTAIALARTYALAGVKTLLIDADMRKPTIARRMGIEGNSGLIGFVSPYKANEKRDIEPENDPLTSLVVIPAGERSSSPTDQLINSEAFKTLINLAVKNFDIVILDSPPLLPVVDTRYLARFADAVVHVVRYTTTTQGEVREAAMQLREHTQKHVHYVGVLSLEERTAGRYGYYNSYSYYGEERT